MILVAILIMLFAFASFMVSGALFEGNEGGGGIFFIGVGIILAFLSLSIMFDNYNIVVKNPIIPDTRIEVENGIADTTYIYSIKRQ